MKESSILSLIDSRELQMRDIMNNLEALTVNKRQISYHEATESNNRAYYYTTTNDGKRIQAQMREELIKKLTEHYKQNEQKQDNSFQAVFQRAIQLKIKTEEPAEKTIRDYLFSYKAFIEPDFESQDITQLSPSVLKEYILRKTKELNLTKKRFYKFKSVLNLVFDYACDPEFHILDVNPVPKSNRQFQKNLRYSSKRAEDKCFQPDEIKQIQKHLWKRINENTYDVNAYAILFSIETGMREAEIPSLRWIDIHEDYVHIHSQQLDEKRDGKKVYYYEPTTKNEKGISRNGRKIPLTLKMREILESLKAAQEKLGIHSEYIFSKRDGEWTTTAAYYKALYRVTKKLELKLSNNHAFRMSLNSYVLIPAGIEAPDRAKFLGHSVETNLKHYTFARDDSYLSELANILDNAANLSQPVFRVVGKKKRA